MDRYAPFVFGFHGTEAAVAEHLLRGEIPVNNWAQSSSAFDWLGHGIYFWEYGLERARAWANKGGVVGAIIALGNCLDLTDTRSMDMLSDAYERFVVDCRRRKKPIPANKGKRRELDCAVINFLVKSEARQTGVRLQTVRGAFLEGDPVYPGSGILRETHIQIAVRDASCILGVFRPT